MKPGSNLLLLIFLVFTSSLSASNPNLTGKLNIKSNIIDDLKIAEEITVSERSGLIENKEFEANTLISKEAIPVPPNPPTVTVSNNCGESVLTASDYSGDLYWSTGETTASITVTAGEYWVTQTVALETSAQTTVTAAPKLIPSAPTVTVVDNCESSTLTATGEVGASFLWDTEDTNSQIIVYTAGSHSVTQTLDGCTSTAGSGTAAPKTTPAAPSVLVEDNCGTSTLTATGIDGASFLWSTAETTPSIIVATAGTYTVTQTVEGCTSASGSGDATPLSVPATPIVNVVNNCGSSDLTASGFSGTLLWSNGSNAETINVTTGGTYTVTQNDGVCTSNPGSGVAEPITIPAAPIVTVTNNCGNSDLTASEFTGTLLWNTEATDVSINVIAAGTYTVTQTVAGCTSPSGSGTAAPITIPEAPLVAVTDNCGNSDLTASGFTGSLLWNTEATDASINVSAAGTYTVTQTVNGCISPAGSGTAAPKTIPTLSATGTNPILCQGQGSIDFTITGVIDGSNIVTYDNGNLPVTISGGSATVSAPAGAYNNLTITAANGCTSASGINVSLSDPNPPATPVITVQNNCGNSVLTASGTTGSLNWSNGATTESITVTTGGSYSLTQTVSGCTSDAATATAAPKAIPALTASGTNPTSCLGQGTINFTFTNVPNGTYTIDYDTGSLSGVEVSNNSATASAVAGTYNNLKITVDGCTSADEINVVLTDPANPAAPTISVENNCGESLLTASNFTGSLLWSNGAITTSTTVNASGSYSVTQTVNNCTSIAASATAAPKAVPVISASGVNPIVCQGNGSINFTFSNVPNGSYTIWYATGSFSGVNVLNNAATVSAPAGIYNNLIIIVNGCTSADGVNVALSDPNPPATPNIAVQNNCGQSVLTASNFTGTLKWSTNEITAVITVTTGGSYSLTQMVSGCTSVAATVTAAPKAIPTLAVSKVNPIVCQGLGTLNFTFTNVPNGSYTINYDGGSLSGVAVSNNAASVQAPAKAYNNLIISVNECNSATGVSATLTDPLPPAAPAVSVQNNCGQSIITASNYTGTLLWNNSATTPGIIVNTAGNYTVTQTVNNCTSVAASIAAAPKAVPTLAASKINPTVCQGQGTINFTFTNVPNGTYTIGYDGGGFSGVAVSNNAASVQTVAGTYNNLNITANGCTSVNGVNVALSDPNPPATPIVAVQNNCGQSVLTASNFTGTLKWSNNATTAVITVTTGGSYSVTQTVSGCTSEAATATAAPKAIPTLAVSKVNPIVCQGLGTLNFTFTNVPNGSYTINYDGGSLSGVAVSNNAASVQAPAKAYNNLIISVNGCNSATGVSTSLTDPLPPAAPTITVQNNCGQSILTASNYTGTLLWSNNATTPSITVTTAGNYTVTQTVNGCKSVAASVTAAPKAVPTLAASKVNPTVCQGLGTINFTFTNVPNGTYDILYDTGKSFTGVSVSNNSATVQAVAGSYNNLTISINGCSSASGVSVSLSDPNPPATPVITAQNNCGQTILTASNFTGTLKWSTGETSSSIVVSTAQSYTVTQTIVGCTSDAATILAIPKQIPVISVTYNDPSTCLSLGTINFTFTHVPNGNYTIYHDGGSFTSVSVLNNVATVTAAAGNYSNLKITVDGCTSANGVNAVIKEPVSPNAPSIDVANNCGESVLTASNYTGTLKWNTGATSTSITVSSAGSYSVTQTLNGCTSNPAIASATPKTVPTLTAKGNNPVICQGQGSIDFKFTNVPNGTYIISYDDGTFTNVAVANNAATVKTVAGTFNNLTISSNGCSSLKGINVNLSDPNAPNAPLVDVQNNCGESVLTASVYTGTLKWSTGETTDVIKVTSAKSYSVTQTVNGCLSTAMSAVAAPKLIPEAPDFNVNNNCDGSSVLTATKFENNAVLQWSTGETVNPITIKNAGSYSLKQILEGCQSVSTVKVATPKTAPVLSVTEYDPQNCEESGYLQFNTTNVPNGIYSILYTGGSFTGVSVLNNTATVSAEANIYENLSIEVNGCISAPGITAVLTTPNAPAAPGILIDNRCGESILTATNFDTNATLKWSTGETTTNITVTKAGTYSVTQTLNGCTSQGKTGIAAPIAKPPKPLVSVDNNCEQITLSVNNLSTGAWFIWKFNNVLDSTLNKEINITESGIYTITQKLGDCVSNDTTLNIMPITTPTPPISRGNKEICETVPMPVLTAEADPPGINFEVIWYDQETGGTEVEPILNQLGTITYYAESKNRLAGCISETRTPVTLTIKPGPKSELVDTTIIGKPKSNVAVLIFPEDKMKYQWFLNNKEIENATGQYYYIPVAEREDANLFAIEVEMNNGCKSTFFFPYSGSLNSGTITGITKSAEINNEFTLYPNPANNEVYIALENPGLISSQKLSVKIFTVHGACVIDSQLSKNPQVVDATQLRPGVYSVVIYSEQQRLFTKKLIVNKQ